jgi:hypothetical protein
MKPQFNNLCSKAVGPGRNSRVQLQEVMGCENWVMILIREIAMLEDKEKINHTTSIAQRLNLAKKIKSIKGNLIVGIQSFENQGFYSSSQNRESAVQCTTFIFAYASLVYLAIATDNPDYNEIAQYVTHVIWAINRLSNFPWILRGLTWPFCISGCMAVLEQRQRFRRIAALDGCFNLRKPLQIMETYWELRDRDQHSRDQHHAPWFQAMARVGQHVLLV